ncbi:MAG: septum formation family protein [Acidimicrobiales bacterium]
MTYLQKAALGLAAALFIAACASEPERNVEGTITESGELDAFSIEEGDCLQNPATESEVASVSAVPCDEPHDMEAFYLFDLPDGDFPAREVIDQQTEEKCIEAFEPYVGIDFASSRLDARSFEPTALSWDQGDREIVCLALDVGGEQLVGSVAGIAE